MRRHGLMIAAVVATLFVAKIGQAKDLGEILLEKGLITPEELRQAREEEKQKSAAEESRRDAIVAKLPKWLDVIQPFGDLRTRDEGFYANDLIARNRFRFRARVGLNITPSDEISATFRLVSGDPNDPISSNQTLNNTFTKKSVNFDEGYLTLRPGKTFHLEPGWVTIVAGKFGINNVYRTSELLWDDDLTPEGATETLNLVDQRDGFLRGLKVNALQWVVDEVSNTVDPNIVGGQIVADTAFGDTAKWTAGFADYDYESVNRVARKFLEKTSSSFNSSLANSNRVDKFSNGKISGFKSDFNIINANSELNFVDVFGVPAGLFGDLAYNTQADNKGLGFAIGAGVGKAGRDWYHNTLKSQGDWGLSYTFERVEQDAVFSPFSYSDIDYVQQTATQKGSSNVIAHILRLDYMLLPNLQLTAKAHLINVLDRASSNAKLSGNDTLLRTQLDASYKF
jgi:hypothetical protein